MTWFKEFATSLYNEIFGEPVNHPLLRRLMAFVFDAFLFYAFLTFIAFILHFTDFNIRPFQELFFGLIAGTFYFSILNSKVGHGRTIGKRIFKLKVVDEQCNYIGIGRSWLRSLPLVLILSFQQIALVMYKAHFEFIYIIYGLFIFFVGIGYFSIAKLNRQGLHDLLVGTQVVDKEVTISTKKNVTVGLVIGFILLEIAAFIYFYLVTA